MNRFLLRVAAFLDWVCEDCEDEDSQKEHRNGAKFEDLFDP